MSPCKLIIQIGFQGRADSRKRRAAQLSALGFAHVTNCSQKREEEQETLKPHLEA